MGKRQRIYSEEDFESWPNCSVPDCSNKVFCGGGSDKCYPHTFYLTKEELDAPPPVDHAAWERRHAMFVERKRQIEAESCQTAQ